MFKTFLPVSVFALTLPLAARGHASEYPLLSLNSPAEKFEVALQAPTNEELLLFWEEKELYVQTATRADKPLSQTPENMTVVSAKEIEDMNAHTVDEVLARVPGLFVDFTPADFASPSQIHIQGSVTSGEDRHVAVLLDGVPWNSLSSNSALLGTIPVQIIERIEIVKGPASSSWGSALGGVINIITKQAGDSAIPKGVVSASYGEANSQDYSGQLYGTAGGVGYYLFAGHQQSDGLRDHRSSDADKLYAKLKFSPSRDLDLVFSTGYSNPFISPGNSPALPSISSMQLSAFFATGALDYRLSPELSVKGGAYTFRNDFNDPIYALNGQFRRSTSTSDHNLGGNLRLVYTGQTQTAVLGAEGSLNTMYETIGYGAPYQAPPYNRPASTRVSPSLNKWAIFGNDTITLGKLTVTPGVRFDNDNISGSFVSPSLGATYRIGQHTVTRASVARGFTSPPLGDTEGSGFFLDGNRNLKAEEVWSYQAGVESAFTDYVRVKTTLFRHDSSNELVLEREADNPPFKIIKNNGKVTRQGFEMEAETAPVYNLSLKAAYSFVNVDRHADPTNKNIYAYQLGLKYDDHDSLMAQLFGSYVWWDLPPENGARYNSFIWDLNLNKKLLRAEAISLEAFLTLHNIFNGYSHTTYAYPNASRWVEGGLRWKF